MFPELTETQINVVCNVNLSAGAFTFNGGSALEGLDAKLKVATINFSKGDGDEITYIASFLFYGGAGAITLAGTSYLTTFSEKLQGIPGC